MHSWSLRRVEIYSTYTIVASKHLDSKPPNTIQYNTIHTLSISPYGSRTKAVFLAFNNIVAKHVHSFRQAFSCKTDTIFRFLVKKYVESTLWLPVRTEKECQLRHSKSHNEKNYRNFTKKWRIRQTNNWGDCKWLSEIDRWKKTSKENAIICGLFIFCSFQMGVRKSILRSWYRARSYKNINIIIETITNHLFSLVIHSLYSRKNCIFCIMQGDGRRCIFTGRGKGTRDKRFCAA